MIKNKYKYVLYDRFGVIDVSPLGEGDFTISYEQDDDGKYFYAKQFNGKLTFTGETYRRLKKIEESIYLCTSQRLEVIRICNDIEQVVFDGTFKLTEGDWSEDFCSVVLKFEKSKVDKCLDENKNVKINLLYEIGNKVTVVTGTPGGVLEYKECTHLFSVVEGSDDPYCLAVWCTNDGITCDLSIPYSENWVYYSQQANMDGTANPNPGEGGGGTLTVRTKWVREVITVSCGAVVPPEWVKIEDCVGGFEKYAKSVTLYNCRDIYREVEDQWNYRFLFVCDIVGGAGGSFTEIDNGVLLNDAIKLMVNRFCGFNVVSDFFQINPANPSNVNYVTQNTTQVNNLILFQKSDVKRPQDFNNAERADWTFEKLMETLRIMFNVYYSIENGVFRLEHISWFTRNFGYDLTQEKYSKYVKGLRRYSYDLDNIPQSETWQYKEQLSYGEWSINTIDYNNTCAIGGNKSKDDKFLIEDVTTDVELCLNNPLSDSNVVEDSGFVMMATVFYDGKYYIITEGNGKLNNTLSWMRLIPNYSFYYRPLNKGVFNDDLITFFSTKPFKKGAKISIPIECGDVFNPNESIKTHLGLGTVDKATFNLQSCMMDLELKYNVFDELTPNTPPVILGKNIQTYKNTYIIFDIDSNDPDGVVKSIKVSRQPLNGHVDILSLTQAKYTPNAGFMGDDFFYIVAYDNWSEVSEEGAFRATVLNENQPPVAVDDLFYVYQGEPFTNVISIFENDYDDVGFDLVNSNVVTFQGIAVSINPDTGIFSYTPPAGYEGEDYFIYSIVDNAGLESSATVTLRVGYKNKPIAVDDHYNIMINNSITTDGSPGKEYLWSNDYTPDGITYTYTCAAETKPTEKGGTVTINTDGTFSYNPPAGFTGTDSFKYTVSNINGSAKGNVFIHVTPVIYVQMIKNNFDSGGYVIECNGINEPGGAYNTHNVVLRFWADSAKTIPFNVDGLFFRAKIKQDTKTYINNNPPSTSSIDWITGYLTGTEHVLLTDFLYEDERLDCNANRVYYRTIETILTNGNYIIVT